MTSMSCFSWGGARLLSTQPKRISHSVFANSKRHPESFRSPCIWGLGSESSAPLLSTGWLSKGRVRCALEALAGAVSEVVATPICCSTLCLRLLFPGRAGRRVDECCSEIRWLCMLCSCRTALRVVIFSCVVLSLEAATEILTVHSTFWWWSTPKGALPVFTSEMRNALEAQLLSFKWQQNSLLQAVSRVAWGWDLTCFQWCNAGLVSTGTGCVFFMVSAMMLPCVFGRKIVFITCQRLSCWWVVLHKGSGGHFSFLYYPTSQGLGWHKEPRGTQPALQGYNQHCWRIVHTIWHYMES